jgi:hypothetical protein
METMNVNNPLDNLTEAEMNDFVDIIMSQLLNDSPTDVNQREWNLPQGGVMNLLTPEEFALLPDGTELLDIFGKRRVKGTDFIDLDTRAGLMAFGLPPVPEPEVTV